MYKAILNFVMAISIILFVIAKPLPTYGEGEADIVELRNVDYIYVSNGNQSIPPTRLMEGDEFLGLTLKNMYHSWIYYVNDEFSYNLNVAAEFSGELSICGFLNISLQVFDWARLLHMTFYVSPCCLEVTPWSASSTIRVRFFITNPYDVLDALGIDLSEEITSTHRVIENVFIQLDDIPLLDMPTGGNELPGASMLTVTVHDGNCPNTRQMYEHTPINVKIDNAISFSDQSSVIVDGRILIPVRSVFEELGFNVAWNENTKTILLENAEYEVLLTIGCDVFTVNGASYTMDVPAQIINEHTMIPMRAVLARVRYAAGWDAGTKTVVISVVSYEENH